MDWDYRWIVLIKFVHVLVAATWVGGAIYFNLMVAPVMAQSTPGTRREFMGRMLPLTGRAGNILGGLTILTGLLYVYALRDGLEFGARSGQLILAALLGAVSILFLLNYSVKPAGKALAQLQAKDAPGTPPSMAQLMLLKKIQFSGRASLVILVAALFVMVWAASGL